MLDNSPTITIFSIIAILVGSGAALVVLILLLALLLDALWYLKRFFQPRVDEPILMAHSKIPAAVTGEQKQLEQLGFIWSGAYGTVHLFGNIRHDIFLAPDNITYATLVRFLGSNQVTFITAFDNEAVIETAYNREGNYETSIATANRVGTSIAAAYEFHRQLVNEQQARHGSVRPMAAFNDVLAWHAVYRLRHYFNRWKMEAIGGLITIGWSAIAAAICFSTVGLLFSHEMSDTRRLAVIVTSAVTVAAALWLLRYVSVWMGVEARLGYIKLKRA